MSMPIKPVCALLLALPIAALADPVLVTTHSVGTIVPDFSLFNVLGLVPEPTTTPLPYEPLLRSTLDPSTMPSPSGFWAYSHDAEVLIDFHVGAQVDHDTGPVNSFANPSAQSANVEEYGHGIWFDTPTVTFGFSHRLLGPTGSMGSSAPLAPLDADECDVLYGAATVVLTVALSGSVRAAMRPPANCRPG